MTTSREEAWKMLRGTFFEGKEAPKMRLAAILAIAQIAVLIVVFVVNTWCGFLLCGFYALGRWNQNVLTSVEEDAKRAVEVFRASGSTLN